MRIFSSIDEFAAAAGQPLGQSEWHLISQERIDAFAETTGDHQWIHVDVARAAKGPFGGTIAHGYLTLSMLPMFSKEIYRLDGVSSIVNYGANSVRFPAPVPVGSAVRGHADLVSVEQTAPGSARCTIRFTVEIEGAVKPALVAETILYVLTDDDAASK